MASSWKKMHLGLSQLETRVSAWLQASQDRLAPLLGAHAAGDWALAFGKGNLTLSSGDREEAMAVKAGSARSRAGQDRGLRGQRRLCDRVRSMRLRRERSLTVTLCCSTCFWRCRWKAGWLSKSPKGQPHFQPRLSPDSVSYEHVMLIVIF